MSEVDFQGDDCRPAIRGQTYQHGSIPTKMAGPFVTAGVEQCDDLSGLGIDSGDIRPLVKIAEDTNRLHPKFSLVDPQRRSR